MLRFSVLVLLFVIAALALNPAWAVNFTAGPLVQVTGLSPFASCTADNVTGQSGQVFLHSEVEPWIDVNPTNANNLVGAVQQDRWSNGGARGLVASSSTNGGTSWTTVVIPGISLCSGGIYDRSTDPWVTFSPNGHVHQLALSFNDVAPPFVARDFDHALLYSKSTNGGVNWSAPVLVIRDLDANVFNDKQSITADPQDSNYVYAVWDRLVFPPSERASVIAGFVTAAFRGPAWFSRTTDGGNTWEPARLIYDPGQNSQTIGNQIVVVPPNGDLVNIFDLIKITRGALPRGAIFNVALIRSTDRGLTWGPRARSGHITPIVVDKLRTIAITDPETGDDVRTGDIIPDIAVAPNGHLYAVWQDARPNGLQADAIVVSKSTNGGLTWSLFAKVNKTPTNIPIKNQQAFTPSVHVAADGTVAVTYYDFRNNDGLAPLWTDYFIVHCHPGPVTCASSAHWEDEIKLTNVSFDMRLAPFARGFFTGDYEGLSSSNLDFTPFFSQPHGSDPSSVFFRRVGVGP
jgi:hypothetical protein